MCSTRNLLSYVDRIHFYLYMDRIHILPRDVRQIIRAMRLARMSARKDAVAATGDGGAADASLASLLHALRSDLQAKVDCGSSDATSEAPSRPHCAYQPDTPPSPPFTNTLLSSVIGAHPTLQASIQQHIQESTHSARVTELQRRRRELQALRIPHEAVRNQQKKAVDRECAKVISVMERQRSTFERHLHQQDDAATQRLQMLLFECVGEMKKAVERLDGVASDAMEEVTSMMDARERRHRWQLFLARLQEDFHGYGLSPSVLFPSSYTNIKSTTALCSSLEAVLHTHGPSIPSDHHLKLVSALSIKREEAQSPYQLSPEKTKRLQASLHFDESVMEAWSRVTADLQQFYRHQRSTIKPTASSASSTRRIRRLPAPSQPLTASEYAVYKLQEQSSWSQVRHLGVSDTPQFTTIECDVPLSAAFIHWLTPSALDLDQDNFDCNVYFDLGEYRHKFSASLHTTDSINQDAEASDLAVLSSVRSALKYVNDILDVYRAALQAGQPMNEVVAAFPGSVLLSQCQDQAGYDTTVQSRVFVRASVIQLVQTTYYNDQFLAQFPVQDRQSLHQLYPPVYTGTSILSTLYVPQTATPEPGGSSTSHQSEPTMAALTDPALHELMLVYIARARHLDEQQAPSKDDKARAVGLSMAQSDAVKALLPRLPAVERDPETRGCIVKNPRGALKAMATQQQDPLVEAARDADYLFVEYVVIQRESENQLRASRSATTSPRQVQELLGRSCQWRSCLDQATDSVCSWHKTLKTFLDNDEGCQYLPNLSGIRSILADSALSRVGGAKRAILRSSSLVDEMASRQLSHSLRAFFDHVSASMTSTEFLKARWEVSNSNLQVAVGVSLATSDGNEEDRFCALQHALQVTREVLLTERRATLALHNLRKLVERNQFCAALASSNVLDIQELNRDIYTTDLELVLTLSEQKLQRLLRLCRNEEEETVAATTKLQQGDKRSIGEVVEAVGTSSTVLDVVHVLRKGRRSLQREQQQHQQQQRQSVPRRPQSAARRSNTEDKATCKPLQRVASDFDQQRRAGRLEKTKS